MMDFVLPCPRAHNESIDHYCRRRLRQARNVCQQVGFWSLLWGERVIKWEEHLKRGERYTHLCARLMSFHGTQWLMEQRSAFVPTDSRNMNGSRNSLFSGRTGTRMNIGRPQPRWQDGCSIARDAKKARAQSIKGKNARTIGTIIREALETARAFVNAGNSAASQQRPS